MHKTLLLVFTALIVMCAPPPAFAKALLGNNTPGSFADLSEKLLPSVVNISSTQKAIDAEDFPEMPHFPPGSPFEDFFEEFMDRRGEGMPMIPPSSLGSGFIIDADKGYIVTNFHVVKDADEVRVTLHDDTTIDAEVIGRDEKTDLALLQVKTTHKLHAVPFGDSDKMRVGDWIVAIGNPFGLGGTVTAGIVSARQRDIQSGPYDDYIQTDASINRGNSGGPMFNLDGEVIGINTAIFSPSGGSVGIGFAIPSALAEPIITQLIEFGKTRRGWLGVRIQNVTDEIAESLGLTDASGALIASVTPTGPAEVAGLQAGDIILEFDGKPINAMRTLPRAVAETPIGKKAKLVFWRDSKKHEAAVTIGELEKAEEDGLIATGAVTPDGTAPATKGKAIESVGMTVSPITPTDREQYQIADDLQGLVITKIEPQSEAAEKGLQPGNVVVEINQKPVTTPEDAASLIDKAAKAGRSSVLLLINHQGDVRFVALKLKK
ncbi:MAG: DegQ family serine endoprotease [Alphaproteobacteria bacterium]|nr:DegQ family serine endoprotease [Alphaproteobacteria bacterium]MBU0859546.1 DegQ family serine endoprotease [Alphaproteobacteria bacterium]